VERSGGIQVQRLEKCMGSNKMQVIFPVVEGFEGSLEFKGLERKF